MERGVTKKNEEIFVDLLCPKNRMSTKAYKVVLVVVDVYSRYTTEYPLHSKNAHEVNKSTKRYITRAERHFPDYPVKKVFSGGGGEFVNAEMTAWYRSLGIELLPNPPHSSHSNLCERAHHTLIHTMKSMMAAVKQLKSLWMEALEMATYLRNRVYCLSMKDIPYRMMMKKKPDLHGN